MTLHPLLHTPTARRLHPLSLNLFPLLSGMLAVLASPITLTWHPLPFAALLPSFALSRIPLVVRLSNHRRPTRRSRLPAAAPRPALARQAEGLPQTLFTASIQTSVLNAPQNPPNRTPAQPKSFLETRLSPWHTYAKSAHLKHESEFEKSVLWYTRWVRPIRIQTVSSSAGLTDAL